MSHTILPLALRENMPGSYLDLVAAIIRSGLKHEGPEYLRTHGGQYWCLMGNLDPEAVRKLAIKQHSRKDQPLRVEKARPGEEVLEPSSKSSRSYGQVSAHNSTTQASSQQGGL